MKEEKSYWCCYGGKKRFPTFAAILLAVGILWLLSDLKIITVDIPWWPAILIIIALGWIINNYSKN